VTVPKARDRCSHAVAGGGAARDGKELIGDTAERGRDNGGRSRAPRGDECRGALDCGPIRQRRPAELVDGEGRTVLAECDSRDGQCGHGGCFTCDEVDAAATGPKKQTARCGLPPGGRFLALV
jgi:hypothetical protein